jgi:hypothetical protein
MGTWLDFETVSPAPVTAQVTKTSRFIARGMFVVLPRLEGITRQDGRGCFAFSESIDTLSEH